jgi:hypothetical protein
VTITLPNLHGKGRKLQTAHTLPFVSALLGNMHNSQPAVVSAVQLLCNGLISVHETRS